MVEFTLVAITFLFVILGVIQLALVLNAQTLVQYAAYNAARAASVHSGNPQKMQEAARVSLLPVFPRHGRADHLRGLTENYLAAVETDQDSGVTYFGEPITETRITNMDGLDCGTVITFDDPKQAAEGFITVRVIHRYELVIPLVNRILFYIYTKFRSGEGYSGESLDNLSKVTDKRRRSGDFKDIEYRIPLVAHYTIRLQSDYSAEACPPPPPPPAPPPLPTVTPTTTVPTTTKACQRNVLCGLTPAWVPPCKTPGWCQIPKGAWPQNCLDNCCKDGKCWDPPGDALGMQCYQGYCDGTGGNANCYCF